LKKEKKKHPMLKNLILKKEGSSGKIQNLPQKKEKTKPAYPKTGGAKTTTPIGGNSETGNVRDKTKEQKKKGGIERKGVIRKTRLRN